MAPPACPHSVFLDDFLATGRGDPAPQLEFEQLPFSHPLFIMYSSGTTGAPKCMVHSAGVGLCPRAPARPPVWCALGPHAAPSQLTRAAGARARVWGGSLSLVLPRSRLLSREGAAHNRALLLPLHGPPPPHTQPPRRARSRPGTWGGENAGSCSDLVAAAFSPRSGEETHPSGEASCSQTAPQMLLDQMVAFEK